MHMLTLRVYRSTVDGKTYVAVAEWNETAGVAATVPDALTAAYGYICAKAAKGNADALNFLSRGERINLAI